MKASTSWKQHTHFVYHCLFVVPEVCVCVVWWFFSARWREIWGQTSGTLGISRVCVCMCAHVCVCVCVCLYVRACMHVSSFIRDHHPRVSFLK